MRTNTKEEAQERLKSIIQGVAEDIAEFGFGALWDDTQFITGGKIIVTINTDMVPTIEYRRETIITPRWKKQ